MRLFEMRWLLGAATIVFAAAPINVGAQQQLAGQALVDALRHGGYVIVMRHATTEAKPDAATVDIANCATQRNLAVEGRTMAQSIGHAIVAMHIPVAHVIESPFCRTRDTADLAFAQAGETNPGLGEKALKNDTTAADAAATLRPLVANPVPVGGNTIIVTHGFNIKSILGADVVEGEAAIFKPDGKGGFV